MFSNIGEKYVGKNYSRLHGSESASRAKRYYNRRGRRNIKRFLSQMDSESFYEPNVPRNHYSYRE